MTVADLAIIPGLVFAWGTLSARLERFDMTAPIVFTAAGVLLTHGPLTPLGITPSREVVKVLAEVTLALVLFSDASRVGLHQLRADMGPCLRLLGIGLPLTIGLGTLIAFILPGVSLLGPRLAPLRGLTPSPEVPDGHCDPSAALVPVAPVFTSTQRLPLGESGGTIGETQMAGCRARSHLITRRQHHSDQVAQRPVQVVLADPDQVIVHAEVVDGNPRDRAVGRRARQGAGSKVFPPEAVVSLGGVHHAALHGAVLLNPGRHDPHEPIVSPAGAAWG